MPYRRARTKQRRYRARGQPTRSSRDITVCIDAAAAAVGTEIELLLTYMCSGASWVTSCAYNGRQRASRQCRGNAAACRRVVHAARYVCVGSSS